MKKAAALALALVLTVQSACAGGGMDEVETARKEQNAQTTQTVRDKRGAEENASAVRSAAETKVLRRPAEPVRGLYVTAPTALGSRMDGLIRLVDDTELNAVVIDVNTPSAGIQSDRQAARIGELVQRLKRKNIYTIARIVTFKDPTAAKRHPEWAIRRKNGGIWRDKSGAAWIDPYRQEAWSYPIGLAEKAVQLGFEEIQFDYVRFPENAARVDREVAYANRQGWSKPEAIRRFLHEAAEHVHRQGARVSADVFGLITANGEGQDIGQTWSAIAPEVDVISPMVYPSHYARGVWGIRHPDLSPGAVVRSAMREAASENEGLRRAGKPAAGIRPWLQAFTATWVHPHRNYGAAEIKVQIDAIRQAGVREYLLWNAASRYPDL